MSRFENFTPPTLGSELTVSELTTVEEITALANSSAGQFIRKEGGSFVNAPLSEIVSLDGLSDVVLSSPSSGQILVYNGSEWVNSTGSGSGTVTSVSVVTANGISGTVDTATTTPAITLSLGSITPSAVQVSGLTASELLATDGSKNLVSLAVATYPSLTELSYVKGVTSAIQTQLGNKLETVAVSDLDNGTDGELITWDASGVATTVAAGTLGQVLTSNGAGAAPTFQAAGGGVSVLSDLSDVVSATNTNRYVLVANGSTGYVGRLLVEADISDLGTYLTGITGEPLGNLSNVTEATPADNDVLQYVTDHWENQTLAEAGIQASGSYITGLTGDVTASGPGSVTATIANGVVTLAKMADMATASFIGRNTAATGVPEVLSATTARSILNVEDGADVTDTANVTAAGALMDSELTDIVAVKALADASIAVTDAGTSTTTFVTPDGLQGSKRNIRWLTFNLVEAGTSVVTGTNIGGDFVSPIAGVIQQSDTTPFYLYATNSTAGTHTTVGTVVDININGTSIATTNKLNFDTTEKTTTTAATPPDLTTTALAVGDIITFDVDSVADGTAPRGLTVYIGVLED